MFFFIVYNALQSSESESYIILYIIITICAIGRRFYSFYFKEPDKILLFLKFIVGF